MNSIRERQYDILVFGATGYTGKYVVEELGKICVEHNVKWCVAGRHPGKLQACLEEIQNFINYDLKRNVGIITADVSDPHSLSQMCSKTRLVLNCVGPYALYGEAVLQACIQNGTHLVDISGEFQYLENTQAKYFNDARDEGVYVVQSCGFDSIPADLGTTLLKKRFNETLGEMDTVRIFVKFDNGSEKKSINIGTWLSAVNSIRHMFQSGKIRKKLMETLFTKTDMPNYHAGFGFRTPVVSYCNGIREWCLSLPAPDVPVIQRSEMFKYQFFDEDPLDDIEVFFSVGSFWNLIGVFFLAVIVGALSFCSYGRNLLTKYPGFFSFGYFSKHGPSRSQVLRSSFVMQLRAIGQSYVDASEMDLETLKDKTKTLTLRIQGPDPAYVFTSICMVHAGLVILEEEEKLPHEGGILTPGAAFAKTTLLYRLQSRGIIFEFIR